MKQAILSLVTVVAWIAGALILRAQDPVEVDAKHYKVEFENNEVRVLHINYGPGEKSVMHDHPESVAVFLTDQKAVFATPDGKSAEIDAKAGEVKHLAAGSHLPKNIGDKPMEIVLVEFKAKPAAKNQLIPSNSLITNTPEEGRQLAVKMARLIIKATQPDDKVRERLRPIYSEDPAMLIAIGQTVAAEFATIAAANNYWRK